MISYYEVVLMATVNSKDTECRFSFAANSVIALVLILVCSSSLAAEINYSESGDGGAFWIKAPVQYYPPIFKQEFAGTIVGVLDPVAVQTTEIRQYL